MRHAELISSFAVRLRDLLSTLEATALLGAADVRLRGLGEHLQFACLALPCDEALVALELASLGRLTVPGVATAEGWRDTDLQFLPSGTSFAYLLGGGAAFAAQLEADDDMLATLAPALSTSPRHALFAPIRLGGEVLGGVALLRSETAYDDGAIAMAERLAGVLSLTLETHRTERVLMQLFATALPDLVDGPTDFADGLARYVHRLRVSPIYRQRLALADAVGKVAGQGPAETELALGLLGQIGRYVDELAGEPDADHDAAPDFADDEDLY